MSRQAKSLFGRMSKTVNVNRDTYAMGMDSSENAEITMYGEIVEERPFNFWTGEAIPGDYIVQSEFLQDLEKIAEAKSLTIRMNSVGGSAGVSILIHNRLRDLAAKGTGLSCIVDGVAMSGGSLIMCACDEVQVNPSSLIMIHKCFGSLCGGYNAEELREIAAECEAWDKAQVSIYKRKTGLSDTVISNMMAKTTYMTGSEAVEKGFADKLLKDAEPLDIAASADGKSFIVRGRNVPLVPGMFAPDWIPAAKPEQAENKKGDGKNMAKTLEELRAEYPELTAALEAQAKAAAKAEAAPAQGGEGKTGGDPVQAERRRIQEIDALAGLFDSETIQAAKYGEHPCTAQEMAYQAAQKAAQQGRIFLAALEADTAASGAQEVGAADSGTGGMDQDSPQAMALQAKADVQAFQNMKAVH